MKKLKDITIILDRSGSMDAIKDSTIEGYNFFLSKQKLDKTDTNLSLVQFDHEYQLAGALAGKQNLPPKCTYA